MKRNLKPFSKVGRGLQWEWELMRRGERKSPSISKFARWSWEINHQLEGVRFQCLRWLLLSLCHLSNSPASGDKWLQLSLRLSPPCHRPISRSHSLTAVRRACHLPAKVLAGWAEEQQHYSDWTEGQCSNKTSGTVTSSKHFMRGMIIIFLQGRVWCIAKKVSIAKETIHDSGQWVGAKDLWLQIHLLCNEMPVSSSVNFSSRL